MSVTAPNYLNQTQCDCAAYLAADSFFANVQVIREGSRELSGGVLFDKLVNDALQGKIMVNGKKGLALMVFCPEGKPMSNQNKGLSTEFEMVIRAVENGTLNASPDYGTGISCEDALIEAMLLMQRWTPLRGHTLRVEEFYKVDLEERGLWAWECIVRFHDATRGREKCETPKITLVDGIATITTGDPDAEIYYTVNGTLPTPKNGIAYEGPLDVAEIETLRAMAWAEGKVGSDCANEEIS